MIDLPTVSAVIPTYNSEKILPLCLESIRGQDYPKGKLEIIIVDGGSEDDMKAIDVYLLSQMFIKSASIGGIKNN